MSKSEYMHELHDILEEADETIDAEINCNSVEYVAFDLLRTALWRVYHELELRKSEETQCP